MIRVAEPLPDGTWSTNAWIKQAILLYFQRCESVEIGELAYGGSRALTGAPTYYDKLRTNATTRSSACAACRPASRGTARSSAAVAS